MSQFRMVYLSLQKTISPIFFFFSTNVVIEANLSHDNESGASAVNATVLFYLPPYMMTESLVANTTSYSFTYKNGVAAIEVSILGVYRLRFLRKLHGISCAEKSIFICADIFFCISLNWTDGTFLENF